MATDLEVRFKASTGELQSALEKLAVAGKAFQQTLAEMGGTAARESPKLSALQQAAAAGGAALAHSWGTLGAVARTAAGAIVTFNQGLELLQRGFRAGEALFDATIGQVVRTGDSIFELSHRLGIGTEELSSFSFVASQAGVPLEDLGTLIRTTSKALSESRDVSSDAFRVLTQGLGMTRAQLDALSSASPIERILALGQAFERFGESATKTADEATIFGRGYQTAMQLVREGPEEIEKNIRASKALGLTWSEEAAKGADALGDSVGYLRAAFVGLNNHLFADQGLLGTFAQVLVTAGNHVRDLGANIPQEKLAQFRTAMEKATVAAVDLATRGVTALLERLPDLAAALEEVAVRAERYWAAMKGAAAVGAAGFAAGAILPVPGAAPALAAAGAYLGFQSGLANYKTEAEQLEATIAQLRANVKLAAADGTSDWLRLVTALKAAEEQLAALNATAATRAAGPGSAAPGADMTVDLAGPPTRAQAGASTAANAAGKALYNPGTDAKAVAAAESAAVKAIFAAEQVALTNAEDQGAAERLRIVRQFTEQVNALGGSHVEATQRQNQALVTAEHAAAQERTAIAKTESDAQRDAELATLDLKKDAMLADARAGRISQTAMRDALRQYYQDRYDIIVAALAREAELTQDPLKLAALGAQTGAAGAQRDAGEQGVNTDESQAKIDGVIGKITPAFDAITSASDQMVQGLIQGTLRWQDAWEQAGQSLVASFANMGVKLLSEQALAVAKLVVNWALGETAKSAASIGGETARTGAVVTGETTKTGAVVLGEGVRTAASVTATTTKGAVEGAWTLKSLAMSGAEAAGKLIAAFAGLPYGAGIAIGIAAAAAIVGVIKAFGVFEKGGDVPADMPAFLHANEMVLPAPIAIAVRKMTAGAAGGATRLGMLAALMETGVGTPGGPAFLSSEGGLESVPSGGAVGVLHPRETVLPGSVSDAVRIDAGSIPGGGKGDGKGKGDGGGGAKDDGDGEGGGKGRHRDRSGIQAAGAAGGVTAQVPFGGGLGGGGGGGGSGNIQKVSIVSAPITVGTKAKGGTVETTVAGGSVVTTPGGGVMPVQQQGIQSVMIVNPKVPVSFSAIQTSFGFIMGVMWPAATAVTGSFGSLTAFAKGGLVPEDMVGQLHAREMVLPGRVADTLTALVGMVDVSGGSTRPFAPMVVTLPPELLADARRSEQVLAAIPAGVAQMRESDRAAFLASLSTVALGGDTYQADISIHAIDAQSSADWIRQNREAIAEPAFDRMQRSNKGRRR